MFLSLQVKIKSKIYLNNLLDYASVLFNCDWLKKIIRLSHDLEQ